MKTIKIFIALLISSLLTSCLTNKPIQSGVNRASGETNRIYQVNNPAFKKQVSGIGVIALIGATAGGAAAMNGASPAMSYDAQGNQTPNSIINVGLGAIAGLGIVSLGNYAGGQGNEKAVTNEKDFAEWTRKYSNKQGKTYIALPNNRIVPKDAELDWEIQKYEDIVTFLQLFPDSKRVEELAYAASQKLDRTTQKLILSLCKDKISNDIATKIKQRYISLSYSFDELWSAKFQEYPEVDLDIRQQAADLVKNKYHAKKYREKFGNSSDKILNKTVVLNALQSCVNTSEVEELQNLFPRDFTMRASDFASSSYTNRQKEWYLNGMFLLNKVNDYEKLAQFFYDYEWVKIDSKQRYILEKYWQVAYSSHENGDEVVASIKALRHFPTYNLSVSFIENFIDEKLAGEVTKVFINSTKHIGAQESSTSNANQQFQQWLNNAEFTAGVVKTSGEVLYVIYGTVSNNSKFTLPFRIDASAELKVDMDLKGTGNISNITAEILKFFGVASGLNSSKVSKSLQAIGRLYGVPTTALDEGAVEQFFYIPALSPKTTTPYAILINFGNAIQKGGLNIGDFFRITTEKYLDNVQTKIIFQKGYLGEARANMQAKWQYFAQNGFSANEGGKLIDNWRGKEYNDDEWKQKWERILARRAEFERIRREGEKQNTILNKSEDTDFKVTKENETDLELKIISDNRDDTKFANYQSIIYATNIHTGKMEVMKTFEERSGATDDNNFSLKDGYSFPVEVSVKYWSKSNKYVMGKVLITTKGSWLINVED